MTRILLALLLTVAGAAAAREPDPLSLLNGCARRLDSSLDVGYERIAARCPELAAALEHSPWAAWLPGDWTQPDNQLSAEGLRELQYTLARESVAAAGGARALHPERVRAVLDRVTRREAQQQGWWARFKRWLRELLTPRPQEESHWWRRLLGDVEVDQAALRLITGLAIALLIAVAVAVVINELRLAGLLPRKTAASVRDVAAGSGGVLTLRDIESAEPRAQPALLLELVTRRLAAQDRLPSARALTVRELTHHARLGDGEQRARLSTLGAVSERLRYGAEELGPQVLQDAVRAGYELLHSLQAPPALGAA